MSNQPQSRELHNHTFGYEVNVSPYRPDLVIYKVYDLSLLSLANAISETLFEVPLRFLSRYSQEYVISTIKEYLEIDGDIQISVGTLLELLHKLKDVVFTVDLHGFAPRQGNLQGLLYNTNNNAVTLEARHFDDILGKLPNFNKETNPAGYSFYSLLVYYRRKPNPSSEVPQTPNITEEYTVDQLLSDLGVIMRGGYVSLDRFAQIIAHGNNYLNELIRLRVSKVLNLATFRSEGRRNLTIDIVQAIRIIEYILHPSSSRSSFLHKTSDVERERLEIVLETLKETSRNLGITIDYPQDEKVSEEISVSLDSLSQSEEIFNLQANIPVQRFAFIRWIAQGNEYIIKMIHNIIQAGYVTPDEDRYERTIITKAQAHSFLSIILERNKSSNRLSAEEIQRLASIKDMLASES